MLQPLLQPQLAAVKSLILNASRFCYGLSYVGMHVNVSTLMKKFPEKNFEKIHGKNLWKNFHAQTIGKDLHKFQDIVK